MVEAVLGGLGLHLSQQSQVKPVRLGGFLALVVLAAALASCDRSGDKSPAVQAQAGAPVANAPLTLTIENHKFTPAEITVPANQMVAIEVVNKDPLAEEFDSTALKVEKVIAGGQSGTVRLHPLDPGRYPFMGEYHSETAQGVVVAK
jgi:plastocyanin